MQLLKCLDAVEIVDLTMFVSFFFFFLNEIDEAMNRCANNAGCSHLCLPIPTNDADKDKKRAECACPDDMVLDGKQICISGE